MDRQEAVHILSEKAKISVSYAEDLYDSFFEKPVVPKYVADWYEEHKGNFETNLFRAINLIPTVYREGELNEFQEWIVDEHTKPFQTLVNMHQFGYEVEEEKRYTVRFKGLCDKNIYLTANLFRNFWKIKEGIDGCEGTVHTSKELEKSGFGWVFDCEGVEVKEVE